MTNDCLRRRVGPSKRQRVPLRAAASGRPAPAAPLSLPSSPLAAPAPVGHRPLPSALLWAGGAEGGGHPAGWKRFSPGNRTTAACSARRVTSGVGAEPTHSRKSNWSYPGKPGALYKWVTPAKNTWGCPVPKALRPTQRMSQQKRSSAGSDRLHLTGYHGFCQKLFVHIQASLA